jgi:hypothetical protein
MEKWAGRRTNGRVDGRDLRRCPCLHREEGLREELGNRGIFVIYNTNSQNFRLRKIGRIEWNSEIGCPHKSLRVQETCLDKREKRASDTIIFSGLTAYLYLCTN